MNSSFKITASKLIFAHLYIDLVVNLLKEIIPAFSYLAYVPDLINVVLLFFIFFRIGKKDFDKNELNILVFVGLLFLYDFLIFIVYKTPVLLFVWGVRNQYRFFVFCLSCMLFLRKADIFKLEKVLYGSFVLNMIAVLIEFILGYRRDYLGGLFGTEKNCNGMMNIYIVLVAAYAIMCFIYKRRKTYQVAFLLLGSLACAACAEIKFFYVELVILVFIAFMCIKGKTMKKLHIVLTGSLAVIISVVLLVILFPEQASVFSASGILNYAKNVNVGAYGFGRTSGLSIVKNNFFNNEIVPNIFGIGVGNAEKLEIGAFSLYSDFYKRYEIYMYYGFYYPFIYIERGLIGLIWYIVFFVKGIKSASKKIEHSSLKILNIVVFTFCILIPLICFNDGSLKISSAGYLAFFVLGLAFNVATQKTDNGKRNSNEVKKNAVF